MFIGGAAKAVTSEIWATPKVPGVLCNPHTGWKCLLDVAAKGPGTILKYIRTRPLEEVSKTPEEKASALLKTHRGLVRDLDTEFFPSHHEEALKL